MLKRNISSSRPVPAREPSSADVAGLKELAKDNGPLCDEAAQELSNLAQ